MADTSIITMCDKQFYPTPDDIAEKMLSGVDWNMIETVLEPSAGKGNLVERVIRNVFAERRYNSKCLDIDCVEVDPYLRQILRYNFSDERTAELRKRFRELDNMSYSNRTKAENLEMKRIERELNICKSANIHIVHDDFLTFHTEKCYSLIIMNPPFNDGDKHLLKALDMQRYGGSIICLLNAETLINPYTNTRKLLKQELDKYNAEIQFIENGFRDAERKANVDIALIKVNIPNTIPLSAIYERMEKATLQESKQDTEVYDLVAGDYIEQAVQRYKVEVAATMELIRQYKALCPYMYREINGDKDPILTLVLERSSVYDTFSVNEYLRKVRLKYWRALFKNDKFTGKLTSNLKDIYNANIDKMADYEFSVFNIRQILVEMNAGLIDGVKKTILDLFDKLTYVHSWYPEYEGNRHYFNGWSSNKAHKIGKKSIIPTSGMFSSYSWSNETFNVSTAYKVISDIEKAFDYLDGGKTEPKDLNEILRTANAEGRTRNIECKYFKVDLFKKGTTHIKYINMDLVEKLNIYAAKNKNWLPPNYGRTSYNNMEPEEKAVVDEFQGVQEYSRIMSMKEYFLSEPTKSIAMLQEK